MRCCSKKDGGSCSYFLSNLSPFAVAYMPFGIRTLHFKKSNPGQLLQSLVTVSMQRLLDKKMGWVRVLIHIAIFKLALNIAAYMCHTCHLIHSYVCFTPSTKHSEQLPVNQPRFPTRIRDSNGAAVARCRPRQCRRRCCRCWLELAA